ncbi:thrombospondin-1-like [Ylistrum balloti]|uniref:thrombospondin-1-like n=1 Tax=Ylistrum balloti TaxID=509963 RepID=UPI002905EFEC|nr:thrombospondin-1-like [Ylistrum balloti]
MAVRLVIVLLVAFVAVSLFSETSARFGAVDREFEARIGHEFKIVVLLHGVRQQEHAVKYNIEREPNRIVVAGLVGTHVIDKCHCEWSDWQEAVYSICSEECGGGIQSGYETRTIAKHAYNGGNQCTGSSSRFVSRSCNTHHCPIDGGWSDYSEFSIWGSCSGDCFQSRNRNRTCDNPRPQYGGNKCDGEPMDVETRDCYEGQCLDESCNSRRRPTDPHALLPRNCKQYVSCSHTHTVMNCSEGTNWNQELVTCDHEHVVGCDDDNETEDEPELCTDGEFISDEENPSVYYRCSHGVEIQMTCPSPLIFNPETHGCIWPLQK